MKVVEIAFTGTPVTDMTRARAFYEGVLGLEVSLEGPGSMLVEYSVGGSVLTIGSLGDAFKPSSDGTFVAFEIENFDLDITGLATRGVHFAMGTTELPTSRFAVVCDPDGNKIMLHERRKTSGASSLSLPPDTGER